MALLRVEAPTFVAGLVYDPEIDRVVETAPILRRWLGYTRKQVIEGCRQMSWRLDILP